MGRLILIVPFRGFILSDKMIQNFSDHSANERTFLAWVRTAIAVMAFGFLVEKFDLFLELAAPSLAGRTLSVPGQKFGNIAGLALIVLGTAIVGIAAARFVITAKNIDREESPSGNRIANRHRTCGAAGPSGLHSIPLSVARPFHEALTKLQTKPAAVKSSHLFVIPAGTAIVMSLRRRYSTFMIAPHRAEKRAGILRRLYGQQLEVSSRSVRSNGAWIPRACISAVLPIPTCFS